MLMYNTSSVKSLEDTMSEIEWLTVKQAAERMGVTVSRVRQLARKGEITGRHWGRDWQIDAASIVGFEKDTRGYPVGKSRPKK
jgi:excisionase family DNA binding protein